MCSSPVGIGGSGRVAAFTRGKLAVEKEVVVISRQTERALNDKGSLQMAHCFQDMGWKWASDCTCSSYGKQSVLDQEGEG